MRDTALFYLKYRSFINDLKEIGLTEVEARMLILMENCTTLGILPFTVKGAREWLDYSTKIYDITERLKETMNALVDYGYAVPEKLRHTTCYHITPKGIAKIAEIDRLFLSLVAVP